MDKLITFILVFSLSLIGQSLLAQENNVDNRIKVDSLIWSNDNTIPTYPHEAKLDSALNAQADVIKRAYENDSTACCIHPFEPSPTLYIKDDEGNRLTGTEAGSYMKNLLPKDYWAVLEFLVEWNGDISEVRLKWYKGDISEVNLTELVKRVEAKPDSSFGFPAPKRTSMYWMLHGE
jgi:hypothetical protein